MRCVLFAVLVAAGSGCLAPPPAPPGSRLAHDHARVGAERLRAGDVAAARRHFATSLEHARAAGDRLAAADARCNLALLQEAAGETAAARAGFLEALALADGEGPGRYEAGVFAAAVNLARLERSGGRFAAAAHRLRQAEAAAAALGTRTARAACRVQRAQLLEQTRDPVGALEAAWEAVRLYEISGRTPAAMQAEADARRVLGHMLHARGERVAAVGQLRSAARLAKRAGDPVLRMTGLEEVGALLEQMTRLEEARLHFEKAYQVAHELADSERARANLLAVRRIATALERDDLVRDCDRRIDALAPRS